MEAYVNGTGWVTLDPWLAAFNGSFGAADPLHVTMALWGIEPDRPPIDLGVSRLNYIETEPAVVAPAGNVKLTAVKQMWLPFVSIFKVSAELPAGSIIDGAALNLGATNMSLGSLAPLQTVTIKSLRFAAGSISREEVQVGKTDSHNDYTPLFYEIALLLAIFGGIFLVKQYRLRKERVRMSKESLTLHDEDTGGLVEEENLVAKAAAVLESDAHQAATTTASQPEAPTLSNGTGNTPQSKPSPSTKQDNNGGDEPPSPTLIQ